MFECHTISSISRVLTKDFYAMESILRGCEGDGLIPDSDPTAFAPKMPVYQPGEKERIDTLSQQVKSEKSELDRKADAWSRNGGHGRKKC